MKQTVAVTCTDPVEVAPKDVFRDDTPLTRKKHRVKQYLKSFFIHSITPYNLLKEKTNYKPLITSSDVEPSTTLNNVQHYN